MEKDTVLLNIKDYNDLRDFQKTIKSNGAAKVSCDYEIDALYYTESEAVNIVTEENKVLNKEINKLHARIRELKYPQDKQPTIEEFKKMSWWQFRNWKRN